jgi:chemotaxis protein methyltransferase CheR
MRGLSEYHKNKYFEKNGAAWLIDPKIRDLVKFRQFNLQNSYLSLGAFDIIFCRYVLIYFSNEKKREVVSKMHGSLNEGGLLFTGNYIFYDLFDNFDSRHYENFIYYSKRGAVIK